MKKTFTPYIILAILFALFNIFAFAIPSDKTSTFWVSYGFTVVMFCIEIIVLLMSFPKSNTPEKQFLSWPILCVGTIYFVIQTVIFYPFKFFPHIPCWIAVIVFSLILAIAIICIIAAKASMKIINNFDEAHRR